MCGCETMLNDYKVQTSEIVQRSSSSKTKKRGPKSCNWNNICQQLLSSLTKGSGNPQGGLDPIFLSREVGDIWSSKLNCLRNMSLKYRGLAHFCNVRTYFRGFDGIYVYVLCAGAVPRVLKKANGPNALTCFHCFRAPLLADWPQPHLHFLQRISFHMGGNCKNGAEFEAAKWGHFRCVSNWWL